ncbi:MAG: ExbD/TolR family protein [Sphingomonadales bacterium]
MRTKRWSYPVAETALIGEVNTTPLIDVMLVLLIIFIISIPMMNHKVTIRLPAPGPALSDQPTTYRLSLDARGAIFWNGAAISESALPARLAAIRDDPRAELQLGAAAETRYERYDRILAIVKRAGIERLGFAGNEQFAAGLDH